MNAMLTDEALTEALGLAAEDFPEPVAHPALRAELADEEPERPWWQRRSGQLVGVAAAVVVAAVLVQSAGSPFASTRVTTDAARTPAGTAAGVASDQGKTNSLSRSFSNPPVAGTSLSAGGAAATAEHSAPSPTFATSQPPTVARDGARVVKTGSISLVVDKGKVGAAVAKLQGVVTAAGGYISDQQTQEYGDSPSATVTLRVPVRSFESVLGQLRGKGFGAKVVSSQTSGKDVTADYADTQAQLTTLAAAKQRYLTILSGAKSIGQVLEVQQRIDDVQGQIDRLEGSRRVLADQSDLASLSVTVAEKTNPALIKTEPTGFSKAWSDARHGFSSGVESLVAHSGRALLVLLVALALLALGRVGWRVARRRLL